MKLLKTILIATLFLSGNIFAESMKSDDYYDTIDSGVRLYKAEKFDQAFKIFNKMSKWGDKRSQFYLGNMYLIGQHTQQNITEGAAWIVLAGEGVSEWQQRGEEIISILTPEENKEVSKLVATYTKEYGMKAQNISCAKENQTGTRFKVLHCTKQKGQNGSYRIF